jgi:hypothetical protein
MRYAACFFFQMIVAPGQIVSFHDRYHKRSWIGAVLEGVQKRGLLPALAYLPASGSTLCTGGARMSGVGHGEQENSV